MDGAKIMQLLLLEKKECANAAFVFVDASCYARHSVFADAPEFEPGIAISIRLQRN
jgi:hypothetical protein